MDPRNYGKITMLPLVISNGTSVSNVMDLYETALVGFVAPAAWTAAGLTIEASPDGTVWSVLLFDQFASSVGYWAALVAGAGYSVDPVAMLPWRYIRLRSGTNAAPVAQGADRTFVMLSRPLA